jgi:multiple sugar transport system permease protein
VKTSARESWTAFWFLFPFLLALVVFFAFAFGRTLFFSFTDYNLFDKLNFVGLNSYADTFRDPLFITALTNTFIFSIIVTILQTIGALLLAIVLNQKLSGLGFFRTAYYFPSIASSAVTTLIFIWLFRPTGLISYFGTLISNYAGLIVTFIVIAAILQTIQVMFERSRGLPATPFDPALLVVSLIGALIGAGLLNAFNVIRVGSLEPTPLTWLSSRDRFLGIIPFPLLVIIIMNSFTTIPTLMLTFLAGLQGISNSVYEAASIDGANPIQQMLFITIPMLRPVTFYVVTVSIIGTLQMFDQASMLDGTAPLEGTITLAYFVYNAIFRGSGDALVGVASAAALILALLTLAVVQLQRRFFVGDEGAAR